jgi:hypothetical protein
MAPGEVWASDVYKLAGIIIVGFFEEKLTCCSLCKLCGFLDV